MEGNPAGHALHTNGIAVDDAFVDQIIALLSFNFEMFPPCLVNYSNRAKHELMEDIKSVFNVAVSLGNQTHKKRGS